MRLSVRAILPLFLAALPAAAQQPARMGGFGFAAGIALNGGSVRPAAQLSGMLRIDTRLLPIQASFGSSVAELRGLAGAQHDAFVGTHALFPVTSFLGVGAGVELHSLSTRIQGAATDSALQMREHERSGLRPALSVLAMLQLPLAAHDAAALELAARASALRHLTQFAATFGVRLAPWRGNLTLGERSAIAPPAVAQRGSWDEIVQQLMLLQDAGTPLSDVLATPSAVVLKFGSADGASVRDLIARIGRVLNGSSEPLYLTIQAPEPALMAAAATAGGFPAERIRAVVDARITLQATRQPIAALLRSAQSSHPQ